MNPYTLPARARLYVYWTLAPALAVLGVLTGLERIDPVWLAMTSAVAGVFGFPMAAGHVED